MRASSVFDLLESGGCVGLVVDVVVIVVVVVVAANDCEPVALVGVLLAFVMDLALTAEPSSEIGRELLLDEGS